MDDTSWSDAAQERFKKLSNNLKRGPQAPLIRCSMGLTPAAVAVLPALAACLRCPLSVIGKIAAGSLAALVACAGSSLAVIGEVTGVGFLAAATSSGPLLLIRHVVSPCIVMDLDA